MLNRKIVESTLSKGFADALDGVCFQVGNMEYTRRDMVDKVKCGNWIAISKLQKILKKLHVMSCADLARTDPFSLLRVQGIGETTVFVAMCILDHNGYDVEDWWKWEKDNVLKFNAYKSEAVGRARKKKHEVA